MPIRRHVIQHSIRRPKYPGAKINTAPQRICNDIINTELESATEPAVRNIRKSSLKCHCWLKLKKLLRHGNCTNKDAQQEMNIQHISDESSLISDEIENDDEDPEIPKYDSLIEGPENDFLNYIIAPEINQEYLEMEIENFESNLEYVDPECEASGNYSNYFGMEIEKPENKSEIDEETENELQGNDELNELTIEHAQMLQANYEHAQMLEANEEVGISNPNDKLNIEILENIVVKNGSITHAEILKTIREIILLKRANSSTNIDCLDNVTVPENKVVNNVNVNDQINYGNDKILQANNDIVFKQTYSNVEGTFNSKTNEPTAENASTKTGETDTEKPPKFDDFKVPKEVTHSKKKTIKKQQPRFVLTHVVGGHIIQESNFAFPIREPHFQKSKPQSSNTEETAPKTELKEEKAVQEESRTKKPVPTEVKEEETVVQEESGTTEPVPTEVKEVEIESVNEDLANGVFNPFTRLPQSTVKSWTVEDLSNHLLKFNWEETASLLHDNEIDGATLFMVTKTQLMIIGVNEEQADVISEFVQSGPSKGN